MDKILKVIDNDDISNIVQKVEDDPFRLIWNKKKLLFIFMGLFVNEFQ